jgi:hypothetical protein
MVVALPLAFLVAYAGQKTYDAGVARLELATVPVRSSLAPREPGSGATKACQ